MTAGGPLRGFAGLLLGLVLLAPVTAATLTGRVVRILDGDTVEVLNAAQDPERVRLGGIDAPEKAQPFGTQSKQHLADLAGGQAVIVEWKKRDRHGRVVGTLSIVRDGVFGFPMQTAFDISAVRAKPGHIAEISALEVEATSLSISAADSKALVTSRS